MLENQEVTVVIRLLNPPEEGEKEIKKGTMRVTDARDTSVDAALAEILSERGHIFPLKKEEKRELKAFSSVSSFLLNGSNRLFKLLRQRRMANVTPCT